MFYDVIIVGGGMSGLCAAIQIKRNKNNLSVAILERLSRVGKKISLTGNGRCNISNLYIERSKYHGSNPAFCDYALNCYPQNSLADFFYSLGVPLIIEGEKLYPQSLQANSVVDALRFECDRLGVITKTETTVQNIAPKKQGFSVETDKGIFECENIICAAGLLSGGKGLGCDGGVFTILKSLGIGSVALNPSIVQLKTETEFVKQLKGIKIEACATLFKGNKKIREEQGEVLFCDYGLSGPPILQLSGEVDASNIGDFSVSIDCCPDISLGNLIELMYERKKILSYRNAEEFLSGMFNKRLGQVLLKKAGFSLSEPVAAFDNARIKRLCSVIKNFEFALTGDNGFVNSQVTRGGLDTTYFDNTTMMCTRYNRLYAIGELLDITGDCGGYNLQWAFSSAMCAANSIIEGTK